MSRLPIVVATALALAGCAAHPPPPAVAGPAPQPLAVAVAPPPEPSPLAPLPEPFPAAPDRPRPSPAGTWIGAAGDSELLLAGERETYLGVWVDVPVIAREVHAPVALSLVIDTSGSMTGAKIAHARGAARDLVQHLADGDLVAIETFADEALERVPPTVLGPSTRPAILAAIASIRASGGTNMFDGLRAGESRVLAAPASYAVRRVLVISDGMANIGPSSPEILGQLAARGADRGVQVTAIGVGLEYDERTLNALAVRSSGRLYHLGEPRDMEAILARELELLDSTMATDAVVEIVPAPGVQLLGAEGVRADRVDGALHVPLGSMFGGQHRELAVRVRVAAPEAGGARPLASGRLRFRDPADGGVERMQEVVARYEITSDATAVERRANARTRAIVSVQEAAQIAVRAAQQLNAGQADEAGRDLARVEARLRDGAKKADDAQVRARMEQAAASMGAARAVAQRAAAAPAAAKPAAMRAGALDVNSAGMKAMGY
jgi:Ca-activated chloride channel family protein